MRRLALYFASVCLALTLVANVASYFGISLFEKFAFLHLGIFVLGISAAFSAKRVDQEGLLVAARREPPRTRRVSAGRAPPRRPRRHGLRS